MRRIRTGIFGGSFNPIHNGHVALAERILRKARLDEVWLLVTPQNPWKSQSDLLDDNKRLEMVKLAVEDRPRLIASDFEFHLPRPSYTWNTLQALVQDFPDRIFSLIVGGDNWAKFNSWYEHDKILAHHRILVYPRRDCEINVNSLPKRVRLIPMELIDISSTEIRRRIQENLSYTDLVSPKVAEYIEKNKVYLDV